MTIKELRIKKRLTQSEFALSIGVQLCAVYLWEKGTRQPSLRSIKKIEETYKVKLNY